MRGGWAQFALWLTLLAPAGVLAQQSATLEQARTLYDAGQLPEARRLLEELSRSQPPDGQVYLLLGVIERTEGDLGAAVKSLERARALDPSSSQYAVELATTLAWRGDLDRAIGLYQEILTREPAHVGARVGIAYALAWSGRLDRARALFRELIDASPGSIDAWNGLGFVDRASLHRLDAVADYQRALAIDPKNADALAAIDELHWDRRFDLRILMGTSSVPQGTTEPQGRLGFTYDHGPRLTLGGAYQHYAYGAVLPIGGGEPEAGSRTEEGVQVSVTARPTRRWTIGNTVYGFFSADTERALLWEEVVFAATPRLSFVGVARPAYNSTGGSWLFAGAGGVSVGLPGQLRLAVRGMVAGDPTYEPRFTWLTDLVVPITRQGQLQVSYAHSDSDPRYAFDSLGITAHWLLTPSFGLTVNANRRTTTFERSEAMFGIVMRR